MERKPDVIILYSGGTDSRLMLEMALEQGRKPLLVHVRYGQQQTHHDHPLSLFQMGHECREVTISNVYGRFDRTYGDDIAQDYIPNRNMILCSIAGAIAEQEGISEIWLGANATDIINMYPDCTPIWQRQANRMLALLPTIVSLNMPLQDMTQDKVVQELDGNARK